MKTLLSILSALGVLIITAGPVSAEGVSRPDELGASLTKKFPFSMAGQLVFLNGASYYQGSGTVVYQRSVLTAAHNLWSPDSGWSTDVEFNRARIGPAVASSQLASRLFIFGSYRNAAAQYGADSIRAFSNDLGGLRFNSMPASGMHAGWQTGASLLSGSAPCICLGYGADVHPGDELLVVRPSAGFTAVNGAFMENFSLTFEGGMSGGPVFCEVSPDELRIVGVVVAGSDDPPAGAIRAIDASGAAFINSYLRY